MILLQKNRKTVKEYADAYTLADELPQLMANEPITKTPGYREALESLQMKLKQNAFYFAILGAKMTFWGKYRIICDKTEGQK